MTKDTLELPPDEAYAVHVMRETGESLFFPGGPLLMVGNIPTCTWDTLFRMLGRGVCQHMPTMKRYVLTEEWR